MFKEVWKNAFTLAEVLITLGIIGVLAAITIPALNTQIEKGRYYVQMKKAYSVLSDAAALIKNDNGGSMDSLFSSHEEMANIFKPHLRTIKFCPDQDTADQCYLSSSGQTYTLDGRFVNGSSNPYYEYNWPKLVTSDGFVYIFARESTDCTSARYIRNGVSEGCGFVEVDLNGKTLPNTYGKDIFRFSINKYNVTPHSYNNTQSCNKNDTTYTLNGIDCAYKAISEGGIYYY